MEQDCKSKIDLLNHAIDACINVINEQKAEIAALESMVKQCKAELAFVVRVLDKVQQK